MKALALVLALLAPVDSLDVWVQQHVLAARSPALDGTMRTASRIGTPTVVLGALLAIAIIEPVEGVVVARTALLALIPTNVVVESFKRLTQRHRPSGDHDPSNSSFPSSHAANAFALATVFARRWRRAAPVFWLAAALVAVSRVYLNRHFASDVIAGAVFGVACAVAAAAWMDARRRRREARPPVPPGAAPGAGPGEAGRAP